MDNILNVPYEISVWEDIPTTEYYDSKGQLIQAFQNKKISEVGDQTITVAGGHTFIEMPFEDKDGSVIKYMDETKSAIIGSNTMDSPIKAFDPCLKQNVNGQVTLTFSIFRKYFDEEKNEFFINPFSNLLINEQKLKLKYKDKWFDLIIKDISEDSENETMFITAASLPITELAKTGYNLEYDIELKNNIGTITELASDIVKHTDWEVDIDGSDLLEECLEEALYEAPIITQERAEELHRHDLVVNLPIQIQAENIRNSNDVITLHSNDRFFIFYSSLCAIQKNTSSDLHIIYAEDGNYEFDENNVIVVSEDQQRNKQYIIHNVTWHEELPGSSYYSGLMYNNADLFVEYSGQPNTKEKPVLWPSYIYRGEKLVHNSYQVYEPISKMVCTLYHDGDEFSLKYSSYILKIGEMHSKKEYDFVESIDPEIFFNQVGKQSGVYSFVYIYNIDTPDSEFRGWAISSDIDAFAADYVDINYAEMLDDGLGVYGITLTDEAANIDVRFISVEINKNPQGDIYSYSTYKYITSDVVSNYIGDGDSFTNSKGWIDEEINGETTTNNISHTFYPSITSNQSINPNQDIHKYLCVPRTPDIDNRRENTQKICTSVSSAFAKNKEGLIQGNQLVFRWSVGECDTVISRDSYTPTSEPALGSGFVAGNYQIDLVDYRNTSKGTKYGKTYCSFESFQQGSSFFPSDSIYSGWELKLKSDFETSPSSTKTYFTYNETTKEYEVFNGSSFVKGTNYYIKSTSNPFYYSISTPILESLSADQIVSGKRSYANEFYKLGLRIKFIKATTTYTYIESVQLFDYQVDANGNVIFIGSVPTSEPKTLYKYFTIPENALKEEDLEYFYEGYELLDLEPFERVHPFEKVRTITGKQSNRFNLLQGLCETFECWLKFNIHRDNDTGKIVYKYEVDERGIPIEKHQFKQIQFKKIIGEHNYRGFHYSTNLKQIQRDVNSDAMVSKLIVGINSNEFGHNGLCTIQRSQYNPIKESFCLNFDYYIKNGLLDQEDFLLDLYTDYQGHLNYYTQLNDWQADNEIKSLQASRIEMALTNLEANQKVYSELVSSAKEEMTESMEDIKGFIKKDVSDSKALEIIAKYASGAYDNIDQSSAKKYLEKYNTNKYNYYTYMSLEDQYTQQIEPAKISLIKIRKEIEEEIEKKKELEGKFYQKYARFIQEGSWIDESYYDDDLYYLDAQNVLYDSAFPQVTYTINVIDLDELEDYQNYHYNLGDITYVEDPEFFGYIIKDGLKTPYQEEVLISETVDYLDAPEKNQISIQNYKTQFEDLFQKITATTQTLQYASGAYDRTTSIMNLDGTINGQMLSDSVQNILGTISNGYDQTTELSEDGILSKNKNNMDHQIRFKNGAISSTTDNGQTWQDIITPEGIDVKKLTAGTINTSEIIIYGGSKGNSTFRWDSNNLIAYKTTTGNDLGYDESTYAAFNQEGIRSVKQNKVRARFGEIPEIADYGFALYNNSGDITLYADSETGSLHITGNLEALSIVAANNNFVVDEDGFMTAVGGTFELGKINQAEINQAAISYGTIDNADISYGTITSAAISYGTIDKATITEGTIKKAKIEECDIDSASIGQLSFGQIVGGSNATTLYASDFQLEGGTVGGWTITENYIQSDESWSDSRVILCKNGSDGQAYLSIKGRAKFAIGGLNPNQGIFGADSISNNVYIGSTSHFSPTDGGPGPSSSGILYSYGSGFSGYPDFSNSKYYYGKTQAVLIDKIAIFFVNGIYVGWEDKNSIEDEENLTSN